MKHYIKTAVGVPPGFLLGENNKKKVQQSVLLLLVGLTGGVRQGGGGGSPIILMAVLFIMLNAYKETQKDAKITNIVQNTAINTYIQNCTTLRQRYLNTFYGNE